MQVAHVTVERRVVEISSTTISDLESLRDRVDAMDARALDEVIHAYRLAEKGDA